MRAMILAAGLGTRLRPLTDNTPKALVKVNGVSLLERNIRWLMSHGITEMIVNVHYLGEQIIEFLEEKDHFGIRIEVSDEREELLETGGGIQKVAWFLDDRKPFLVSNSDVLTDLDIGLMYEQHRNSKALASLAVRHRSTSRTLIFDESQRLCGFENLKTGQFLSFRETDPVYSTPLAFSGVHIINPEFFALNPYRGKHSITHAYFALASQHIIQAHIHDHSFWMDVGTHERLERAEREMKERDRDE